MPSLREGVHVPGHLRPRMVVFPRPMVSDGSALGHEERFPPPRLNAGCGFRKETIAEMRRNGRDAPFADLADRAPHLFKRSDRRRGDSVPPAAGIFCRTLAAERFTAVIRWVL